MQGADDHCVGVVDLKVVFPVFFPFKFVVALNHR